MYLNKHQISTYIQCPFKLAIETFLNAKIDEDDRRLGGLATIIKSIKSEHAQESHRSQHAKQISDIKNHILEIASYEMKNDEKLSLSDYRVKYTNKYFSKSTEVLNAKEIIKKLNSVFEIFADHIFLGYSAPVDIPIFGTNIIYRDTIDFIMTDGDSKILAVAIDDLTDFDRYKNKLASWAHYYTPYSFLAASFGKPIDIMVIDPVDSVRLTGTVHPEKFDDDINDLKLLTGPIQNNNLIKNLYMCELCEYRKHCH